MKLNRKGFMMAEVVVVSSVILIVLTTLYISYNKIFSIYETRLNYEDSNLVYALAYYRDVAIESGQLMDAMEPLNASLPQYFRTWTNFGITNDKRVNTNDRIYLLKGDTITNPKKPDGTNKFNPTNYEDTFKEYVDYLKSSTKLGNYILIMARCENNTKKEKCKYAHLDLEI